MILTKDDLKLNTIYYTCKPSIESENYSNPTIGVRPAKPHPVMLSVGQRGVIYAHRFYSDPPHELDLDTNATALVSPKDLFESEEEAWVHYNAECIDYTQSLLGEVRDVISTIKAVGTGVPLPEIECGDGSIGETLVKAADMINNPESFSDNSRKALSAVVRVMGEEFKRLDRV